MSRVLQHIRERKREGGTGLAVLLDPDDCEKDPQLDEKLAVLSKGGADLIFIGGSLVLGNELEALIQRVRKAVDVPLVLFPGSPLQLSDQADATLFLSLISGRNPELLIGQQVLAAPHLKRLGTEVIPTGYMLIDGGRPTTASYMSASSPIPRDKADIAMSTALAGEMLGMGCIYMDAGSGAEKPIPAEMIQQVSNNIQCPLIVGGGVASTEGFEEAGNAGADLVVIGSAFEKDPSFLEELLSIEKGSR